ncbi:MAG TPA: hypothetical protein VER39_16935 [Nocardioidaceae bacterium]|nr:hypothetical protein [Nocardioidaceae bacterium]
MATHPGTEEHVRDFARVCVRAGLLSTEEMHAAVVEAITTGLPDRAGEADELATAWLAEEHDRARENQRNWPESTDFERLQSAFAEMELLDVSVLQGCEDHRTPTRLIEESDAAGLRGVAWFTPADVWHAVDEGMLAVTLWHGTTANAAPDDDLLYDVLGILEKHGLVARFDEGRIEVDAHWQKPMA